MPLTKNTTGYVSVGAKTLLVADTGNPETIKIQIDFIDPSDRYIKKALDIELPRKDIPDLIALLEGVLK